MSRRSYDEVPAYEVLPAALEVPDKMQQLSTKPKAPLIQAFEVPDQAQQDFTDPKAPLMHAHASLHEGSWWSKLVPYLIVVPTIISMVIGSLQVRKYADSGGYLYEWSMTSRALVQVFVHVLSSILSILWVYPVCTVVSHWTRNRLAERHVNLNTVRLWSAFTQARTDWNLPWPFASLSLAFFTMTYVPATLWAGALTPSFTLMYIDHGLSLLSK
jgi:hypothetical protein